MKSKKSKKSILIIGLGKFGRYLALKMQELGNQVMVVDKEEAESQKLATKIDDIFIGDCTNEEVLKSLGITDFDICFVTIGENFEASITITMLLKKLGARYTVVKTGSDLQSDLLKKIGADEIIYQEKACRKTFPEISYGLFNEIIFRVEPRLFYYRDGRPKALDW